MSPLKKAESGGLCSAASGFSFLERGPFAKPNVAVFSVASLPIINDTSRLFFSILGQIFYSARLFESYSEIYILENLEANSIMMT
jgi:hypothetical protein